MKIKFYIKKKGEANLDDEPRWYDMKDKPMRKNSNTSVTFKSSSNDSQDDGYYEKRKRNSRHSCMLFYFILFDSFVLNFIFSNSK